MSMMVVPGPRFGPVPLRGCARVMPPALDGGRTGLAIQANAGDRDKTLSCSCLVSKRKNFVSRGARTTPLRSVVLPAWG